MLAAAAGVILQLQVSLVDLVEEGVVVRQRRGVMATPQIPLLLKGIMAG
jgi:hypothetical protein